MQLTRRIAGLSRWHAVSISGWHIGEAGSTAAQELAFALKDGLTNVEQAVVGGLDVDDFALRLSFFLNAQSISSMRSRSTALPVGSGLVRCATVSGRSARCWLMLFHTQTAGVS